MCSHCIHFLVLSLVLVLGGIASASDFAGGTGEPNDPYLIATAEQLIGAGFSQPDVYYRLSADIDLAGQSVYGFHGFEGHLDGDGHAIGHARIMATSHLQGLFGEVYRGATISNLILADFAINVPGAESSIPADYVGGLAGANYGTISNCHATGAIVSSGGGYRIGGLVGINGGWTDPREPEEGWRGVITGCSFDGPISANWEGTESLGGLVGWNAGVIVSCRATGVVSGKAECMGGLVGRCSMPGAISDCYATTVVLAELGGGGLVGVNSASLTRCYASGLVTGELRGGLVGMGWYGGTVTACLWDVYITNCETSGGGMAMGLAQRWDTQTYAANGWAGDPNWVMEPMADYPRLVWEGTSDAVIPGSQAWSFDGSGTENDPYQIASTDQLAELARSSILWDKYFVLVDDLDLSGWAISQMCPIGISAGSSFSGSFDGQGHAISNLSVCHPDGPAWNLGLFGYVTGQVSDLHLLDFAFETGMESRRIGLLAGTCDGGAIQYCTATGSISVGSNSQAVGQLVGYNSGEVLECGSNATVTAGEDSTDIGGFIGADERDDGRLR